MTVTGNLLKADGTARVGVVIQFLPEDTPKIGQVSGLISSPTIETVTGAAGAFSVTLQPGLYMVRIGTHRRDEGRIVVGTSAGPTDINALWVAPGITVPSATAYLLYNPTTGTWYNLSLAGAAGAEVLGWDVATVPTVAGTMLYNPSTSTWYRLQLVGAPAVLTWVEAT